MPQELTNEIINAAIEGFESQKKRIDSQIADLKAMLVGGSAEPTAPVAPPKRAISATVRRGMALGQKKRWAAIKKTAASQPTVSAEAPKGSRLSAAGRRAIAAAAKTRWAVKYAAEAEKTKSPPAKKTVRKKSSRKVAKKLTSKKPGQPPSEAA